MAIIPLRQYNREIESMIDSGQLDEAVEHCRHILVSFPKHIATYRLLGKAHLEQQRYGDAADVFQRVLSSVPDDFVAHVGMSIIREDEANLDAALWFMERASESQPSNNATKDELRRLYGRRDGIEPPKVRLTRGALARMYAKGGLYDQAVAELRAALAEDPNRPDLLVLLAQMYFHLGQQIDAVDTCGNLIKKLPFCLVANRILALILPGTDRAGDTQTYHQRCLALDPYFATAASTALTSDSVSEQAVTIERLLFKPGQMGAGPSQPAWAASLGVAFEDSGSDQLPEWLQDQSGPELPGTDRLQPSAAPFSWETPEGEEAAEEATAAPVDSQIPDWMKEAGWNPATGAAVEGPGMLDLGEPSELQEGEAAKADIPDWLQGLAPVETGEESPPSLEGEGDEAAMPWLQELTPGATDTIIDWLGEKKPEIPTTETPPGEEAQPSDGLAEPASTEAVPDWLRGLEESQQSEQSSLFEAPAETPVMDAGLQEMRDLSGEIASEPIFPAATETAGEEVELPDWLQGMETTEERSGITDWLDSTQLSDVEAGALEAATAPAEAAAEEPAAPAEEVPDWFKEMAEAAPSAEATPSAEEITPSEEEPAEAEAAFPAATEQLASIEPVTEVPAGGRGGLLSWLEPEAETPVEAEPAPTAEEVTPAEEAMLAEPAGEAAEPMGDVISDWLKETFEAPAGAESAAAPEEVPSAGIEELPEAEPVAEEAAAPAEGVPDWLKETFETEGVAEELAPLEPLAEAPATPAEELPDWMKGTDEAGPAAEEVAPVEPVADEAAPPAELMDQEAALAWLEGLAAQQGAKEEELITPADERLGTIPEWVKLEAEETPGEPAAEAPSTPTEGVPEWLKAMGGTDQTVEELTPTEPVAEEPAPAADESVPPWLRSMGETAPLVEPVTPLEPAPGALDDGLPDWLKEMDEAVMQAKETAPAETAAPADELPAWLKDLEEATPLEEEVAPAPVAEEPAAAVEELPAWLKEMAETPLEAEPVMPVEAFTTSEPASAETAPPAEGLPGWLAEMGEAIPAAETGAGAEDQLPAEPEPAAVEPAEEELAATSEGMPDWSKELSEGIPTLEALTPAIEPEAVSAEETFAAVEELPAAEPAAEVPVDLADQDAALAWLEGLAAQHGAKEEELITPPDERLESIPDWVKAEAAETPATLETPSELAAEEPEAQAEGLPDWLQEVSETAPVVEEITPAELPAEEAAAPAEGLPDWLQEVGEATQTPDELTPLEPVAEEAAVEGAEPPAAESWPDWLKEEGEVTPTQELAPSQPEPEVTTPAVEEPAAALPVDLNDQDAALAWLEGLAAQHGAREEELITPPEDRLEAVPDWIKTEAAEAPPEGETPSETAPAELEAAGEELPAWLEEKAEIVPGGEPVAPAEEPPSAEPVAQAEGLPDWLSDTAATSTAALSEVPSELPPEPAGELEADLPDWLKDTAAPAEATPAELPSAPIEALPDWLGDVEKAMPIESEAFPAAETPAPPAWMPEAILPETPQEAIPEPPLEAPAAEPEPVQITPEVLPTVAPAVEVEPALVNINTASLSELEALPGIGFVLAQNIILYREAHGPYSQVEDLENATGLNAELIAELRDQLTTGIPPVLEAPTPLAQTADELFVNARQAVDSGDATQAAELYARLVKEGADPERVVSDMQMALYRYPVDTSLWQVLGDAYLRSDKLQEALDAYTKAEELLR